MLTEQTEILNWWKEYFDHLLNQPSVANASVLEQITQRLIVQEAKAEPTDIEVLCVVKSIAPGKTVGRDGIQVEVLHIQGSQTLLWFTALLSPSTNAKAIGMHVTITIASLLSIVRKILVNIILSRLKPIANSVLPELQCGFSANRSTADMVFTLGSCRRRQRNSDNHYT